MSEMPQFHELDISELRDLLEDDEKINQIIRCNEKFQELKRAAENMLVSNCTLAEASLSLKPAFSNTKLLLAMKYDELEKLVNIIQVKQVQLEEEKSTTCTAQLSLLKKTACEEKESEILFQRFVEGKTAVVDFLVGFQNTRKLYHIRQVLLKKIPEVTELKAKPHRPIEFLPNSQHFSSTFLSNLPPPTNGPLHYVYHALCSLSPAVILPPISYPFTPLPFQSSFLMPFGQNLQGLPFTHFDYIEPIYSRQYIELSRGPPRPTRLQKLKPRKHHSKTPH